VKSKHEVEIPEPHSFQMSTVMRKGKEWPGGCCAVDKIHSTCGSLRGLHQDESSPRGTVCATCVRCSDACVACCTAISTVYTYKTAASVCYSVTSKRNGCNSGPICILNQRHSRMVIGTSTSESAIADNRATRLEVSEGHQTWYRSIR